MKQQKKTFFLFIFMYFPKKINFSGRCQTEAIKRKFNFENYETQFSI
jgi:hypothetical protein